MRGCLHVENTQTPCEMCSNFLRALAFDLGSSFFWHESVRWEGETKQAYDIKFSGGNVRVLVTTTAYPTK